MWPTIGRMPAYGFLYCAGILVHFWASYTIAKRTGLDRRVWMSVSTCYLVGMTFGAKLLYDVHHSELNLSALFSAEHYLEGGLWGGLLAYLVLAVPAGVLLSRQKRSALDLIALSVPIPFIMAKLGCLLNGCCYGRASSLPWAITFPEGAWAAPAGVPLHPTQVYEMIIMGMLLLVFKTIDRDRWRGTMLLWLLTIYGFGRFVTDLFRRDTDRHIYLAGVTPTQALCLTAAIVSVLLLILWARTDTSREHIG